MQSATRTFITLVQLTKGQPVMGTNVHWCWQLSRSLTSEGKGLHFSPFPFLSSLSLCTVFFPPRDISQTPSAVNTAGCRCLRLSCRLSGRQTSSCCSDACLWTCLTIQHRDACYILFWRQELPMRQGEWGKAGAWREQRASSPMAPSWHRFSGSMHLPGTLLLSIHLSRSITHSLRFMHTHICTAFASPSIHG